MDLPKSRVLRLSVVLAVACSAVPDDDTQAEGGRISAAEGGSDAGGSSSGGNGSGGVSPPPGGATWGGRANGGSSSAAKGGAANGGNANAGGATSASGGGANGGRANTGGRTNRPQGGSPNASGGAPSTAGAGSCVKNLGCMLTAPASSGDVHQDCVDRVNQFRTQCACLPALARWTDGEACADQMAQYDSEKNMAHAGYGAKICTGGQGQNECPGWGSNSQVVSGCLQQMWNEGPPPTSTCTGDCFNEHGHFINMTSTSATKVACGFFTMQNGKVWAVQNFSR